MSNPLVSIIVVTYHSEKYVLETLESAKTQTYRKIELIIADDGSTDNTVQICKDWLVQNKDCFVRTELITVEKNTGIPANCNRGVKAAQGQWIKLIAGDDILLDNCIEDNIQFAIDNDKLFVITKLFFIDEQGNKIVAESTLDEVKRFSYKKSVLEKLRYYCRTNIFLNTPTYFFNRFVYDKNNGFDEDFEMLEDNPFMINTLKNNIDVSFNNVYTVNYRIHTKNVSRGVTPKLKDDLMKLNKDYKSIIFNDGNIMDKIYSKLFVLENYYEKNLPIEHNKIKSFFIRVSYKLFWRFAAFLRKIA